MTNHYCEFPFEEIRAESGDFFQTIEEAKTQGYALNQIWSVLQAESTFVYAPPRHYINLIGYTVTAEPHDDATRYYETLEMAMDDDDDDQTDDQAAAIASVVYLLIEPRDGVCEGVYWRKSEAKAEAEARTKADIADDWIGEDDTPWTVKTVDVT